jgi:tRNA nucleotidyltransferase (CCA-adding enzyme)
MRFEDFVSESTNIKKDWLRYIASNPMISNGVKILDVITKMGYKAYVVGGAVRDLVTGAEPHDIDIATNAPIDELEKKFKTYDIGKSKDFGIVVVNQGGFQYEIAQFRKDGEYTDGRRPDSVKICMDFEADAARRDFCFNAMGIDKDGNILDYFDGVKAIKNKLVKTVGDPNKRFEEDNLRILRAVRFAGKMDFDIDPATTDAIKANKHKLTSLSPERIKDEIWKMAGSGGHKFANSLRLMDTLGILDIILPEVSMMKTTKETERHHPEAYIEGDGTVFDHVMAALKSSKTKDPLINLSVLLHDVGKPNTHKKVDNKHTYFGHAEEAKDIIDTIAKRLKLSNKERNAITFAAMNHMKMFDGPNMKPTKVMQLVNDENWSLLKAVSWADDASRVGLFDKKAHLETIKAMEKIASKWGEKTVNKVAKVVDGNRVLKLTGVRPGKLVGEIINAVTDEVLSNNVKSDKEIDKLIMKYYKELK